MTAEKILQSDVLDILFEGRNKLYGAYELRRTYPRQIKKGIAGMLLAIAILAGGYYLSFGKQNAIVASLDVNDTINVTLVNDPENTVKPETPPPPTQTKPPIASVAFTAPLITKDVTDVPDQGDLDEAIISTTTTPGIPSNEEVMPPDPVPPGDGNSSTASINTQPTVPVGPVNMNDVDQMPEYPGGRQALIRYMVNFLSSELEAGQKFVVKAQFVINQDGQVSDVTIVSSDDPSLNDQVLKAIRKMKVWKPGILHGQKVAVRFTMPVTFVGADE